MEIRGTYRLVNRSAVAIDSIHLATVPGVETGAVAFDRPATLVLADEELGHRIYALEKPLQPGDSLRLDFEVHVEPHGFRNSGVDASVVANGTYFTNRDWLPAIGYQRSRELTERRGPAGARARAAPAASPRSTTSKARERRRAAAAIAFEAVVGTDEDQIAVAPGALRRTWTEGGRRYFHYATDAPIGNEWAFFSADYAVHEATVERRRDPDLPSPGAHREPGPHGPERPGLAGLLHQAVRSLPVQPPQRRRASRATARGCTPMPA